MRASPLSNVAMVARPTRSLSDIQERALFGPAHQRRRALNPRQTVHSVLRKRIVRIAEQPRLSRFTRCNDGVLGRVCVLGGVAVGRAVAAPRAATLLTGAEVNPLSADLHAVLALAADGKLYIIDRADVGARTV